MIKLVSEPSWPTRTDTQKSPTIPMGLGQAQALREGLTTLRNNKFQDIVANATKTIELQLSAGSRRSVVCGFDADGRVMDVDTSGCAIDPREHGIVEGRTVHPFGFLIVHRGAKRRTLSGFAWGPGWRHLFSGAVHNNQFIKQREGTLYLDTHTGKYRLLHKLPTTSRN